MRAVVFTGAGGPEVVSVVERADPEPGPDEVVVSVRFAGLNPADLHQRAGHYPAPHGSPPDVPGLEVAGEVVGCGSRVRDWHPGDRVFGLVGGGGLADRVVVHERLVTRIPERLSDEQAAAVPEAFVTAHDAIRSQAGLVMGELLVVHGAAGGVGTAAVQLGLMAGARVIGTVRSIASAAAVEELGAEALDDDGFPAELPAPADVILELVGAPHFPANLEALSPKGRVVVVGVDGGQEAAIPLRLLMTRRAVIRGTVLRSRPLEEKAAAIRAFEREVVPGLADGRLTPRIDSVHPVDHVAGAFERLAGRGKVGKVLVAFG